MKEQVNTLTFVSLKMEDQAYDTMTEESSFSLFPFLFTPSPGFPSLLLLLILSDFLKNFLAH